MLDFIVDFFLAPAAGILVNWVERTQRGSCFPVATPEALSSFERAKQPKVLKAEQRQHIDMRKVL